MLAVGVQDSDPDFAAVAGIHCSWAVDDGDPVACGKAGAGNHEGRIPVGQGDADTGADRSSSPGLENVLLGGVKVCASVTGMRVHGSLTARDEHFDVLGHESRLVQNPARSMIVSGAPPSRCLIEG